jgi:hypothetical protein
VIIRQLRVNSKLQLPVAFQVLAYRSRADFADAASNNAHRAIRGRRSADQGDGPAQISNVRWNRRRAGSCGMSRPVIARAACSLIHLKFDAILYFCQVSVIGGANRAKA